MLLLSVNPHVVTTKVTRMCVFPLLMCW